MSDVVIQVAPQLRERAPSRRAEETRVAGEIAAKAFAAFERGEPLVSVVQRLRLDPRVVEDLWDRWRRHDRNEARQKLQGGHHAMLGAPVAQLLDSIGDASTR